MGCHRDCNCYCGCDTKGNRAKFAVAGFFLVVFFASFISLFAILGDCIHDGEIKGFDSEERCLERKNQGEIVFLRLLGYLSMAGFIVPFSMLCCCTKNPHKDPERQFGMQMVPQGEAVQAPTAATAATAQATQSMEAPKSKAPAGMGKMKAGYFQNKWEGYQALHDTPDQQ